jgi:pyruvate/2-oxoglutarate dehydrogenase complex dihydrolipoamide acyltransferase (E2) component
MPDRGGLGYRTLPYADAQRQGVDWNEIMSHGHTIHGLVEFDVTDARRAVHAARRTSGRPLSFTSLMVATFARSIAADPSVQAFRKGGGRLVVFDDVDVAVLVEHELDGSDVPIPHIVRRANRKSPAEIDREIAAARAEARPYARAMRFAPLWFRVPAVVRRFVIRRALADPQRRRRFTGTAGVTAVSMFGRGTGWGVPFISHSIVLTVGGIGRRPGVGAGGRIEQREMVCLTLSVDHDVVNGAPLARFISRFREMTETAAPLRADAAGSPQEHGARG